MDDLRTQFLTTADGRALCYAEWGEPSGAPVFLLHGAAGCRLGVSTQTLDIVGELGIRLITYDRPGFGRSDRRPGVRVVDQVEDVEAIADTLAIERFAVTGGSGGTPPALAVAARLADRVIRVLIYGAIAPFDLMGLADYSRDEDDETREYLATVRESEAACTAFFDKLDAEARAAVQPDDPMREAILEQCRQGVAGWVDDERSYQLPWGFDVGEVRPPTAIWANPNDRTTPPNMADWLAARIPGAVLVTSTNAIGHCDIEDPVRARRAIFTWLLNGGEPITP